MNETNAGRMEGAAPVEAGVGSCYSHGWDRMWNYFLELLLVIVVMIVAAVPLTWMSITDEIGTYQGFLLEFFALVYWIMLFAPLKYGLAYVFLKASRSEKLDTKDMLAPFRNYFNAVLANLLVTIVIGIGIVFLIVPGIVLACKLAFVPYLVVDRKLDAIEAFKESWRMTGGHALEIFLIGLLAIPIGLAGIILLGVGLIVSTMWTGLAFASFYYAVAEPGGNTA
jgi:uncharacterized membrane protein